MKMHIWHIFVATNQWLGEMFWQFKFQFFCSTIFYIFLNKAISHFTSLDRFREFCTFLLWWSVLVGTRTSCSEPWCTPPSWLLPSPPPTPLHRSTPLFFWPQMLPLVKLVFSVKDFWSCQMFRWMIAWPSLIMGADIVGLNGDFGLNPGLLPVKKLYLSVCFCLFLFWFLALI